MSAVIEQLNSAGKAFVEFAGSMLVQSVVLIVILLLVDLVLHKKVRAVFRYWIWMLVLLKLMLPPTLSSPLSLGYWFGDHIASLSPGQRASEMERPNTAPIEIAPRADFTHVELGQQIPPVPSAIPQSERVRLEGEHGVTETASLPITATVAVTWQAVVFLIWLAVAVAMGLLLLQRAVFVNGLVAQAKEADGGMKEVLESCRRRMGIRREVGLKVSANAVSPAVCGLVRPVILVPQNLTPKLGAGHLGTVLLHELAHIRRKDLWVNLVQTILQIVYFYNPLLWLANAIIRRIREQAVDEMVLLAMGEKAQQYPQTLVRVAKLAFKQPALSLRLIGVVESKSALAARIKHILGQPMPKSAKLGFFGLLVVVVVGAMLLPMAKGEKTVVIHVSADGSTRYSSIQAAIDDAPAGAVIHIAPGMYMEELRINKPLTLEGAGWERTTIATKSIAAKVFEEVSRVTRERTRATRERMLAATSEDEHKAIQAEFEAELKAEHEQRFAIQSVLVSDTESVVIRDLKLTSPGRHIDGFTIPVPILRFSKAKASVSGCAIVGSPGDGVRVAEGSDVEIRESLVAGVWGTGIVVAEEGEVGCRARILNCDVRNCRHRGISIGRGCDSTVVEGCRISGSAWHGIRYDNASPTVVGNLIIENARSGIYASGLTGATVKQNLFYNNRMCGVSCWFQNGDTIEENTFASNKRSGLEVLGACKPIVRKNIFYGNPIGVFCGDIGSDSSSGKSDGVVTLENNLFWDNERKVIWRIPKTTEQKATIEEPALEEMEDYLRREPQFEDIELTFDERAGNMEGDPLFVNIEGKDFSLLASSPARLSGIGASEHISFASPWPLQGEEIPIIPEPDASDSVQLKQNAENTQAAKETRVPVGSLDHFVGRYAMAERPDRVVIEVTKEDDLFVCKGVKRRVIEMEQTEEGLRYADGDWFLLRYDTSGDTYYLDKLGTSKRAALEASMRLVKISAEEPRDIFAATLPNGVTVELVGLFRGKSKETITWWCPDGNEITKGEFASYSRKIQDKWIRDTDFWKFEYGYALKLTPSEDVSVGTSATIGQTTHNSPATGGKCVAIVESDETMRERGLADIGEVIVSVAYGGWKDFGGQKSIGYEDIYPLENGSTILISDVLPSRTQPESMSSVVVTDNSPDDIEIRVVYELKDGRVCEAWKLSWIGARRKSRGSPLVQTTFDIPAKRQDIKHLWVEYRPCYELRFKDVSLRPGMKTDVEVEGEGSAKVLTGEGQSGSSAGIVAGRVLDEKGDGLSDAQVALCTAEKGVVIREGKLEPTKTTGKSSEITKTDTDGRFSFSRAEDDFHIIVAHEKGFAWITAEEMVSSSDIQAKPWGQIEGTLRIGSEPGTDKRMGLLTYINKNAIDQGVRYDYDARTDERGRFVFERVPAGWAEVGYMIRMGETSYSYTNRTRIEIKPGQTLRLTIGGTGRPVVGKFVPPEDYDQPIYFGEGLRALVTARPEIPYPEGMTEREKEDWYSTWRESEEGRTHWESYWHNKNCRHFVFMINSDGTFRIEDVPAGKYQFTVWIEERDTGPGRPEEIASYDRTIEVPEMPGGRSDEPLDLGNLELKMVGKEPAEQRDVQVEGEEGWGEAVEGVQCQLRAHKIKWRVGEIPTFKVDVRNGGERHLQLPESPDHCLVEVDGRWFFISGYEPGKEVGFSTRVLDFLPGQQRTGIPLELSDKWETMLDSEVALGAYVRRAGIMTGPGLRSRLKLTPGRHTIHVSFILGATRRGVGLHPPAPVQVVSNPVEIEILPADSDVEHKTDVQVEGESGWGEGVDGLQLRLRAEKLVWESSEAPILKADVRNNGTKMKAVPMFPLGYLVEIDGVSYSGQVVRSHWGSDIWNAQVRLAPGEERIGVEISLDEHTKYSKGDLRGALGPGKHVVCIGFPHDDLASKENQFFSNPVEIEILPEEKTDVQVEVEGVWSEATGRAVDVNGQGISGAILEFWKWDAKKKQSRKIGTAQADETGRFKIPAIEAGKSLSIWISADGFAKREAVSIFRREDETYFPDDLSFQLKRLGIIEGQVIGPDGKPLAHAPLSLSTTVRYQYGGEMTCNHLRAVTDEKGRFCMEAVPPGTHLLYYPWSGPTQEEVKSGKWRAFHGVDERWPSAPVKGVCGAKEIKLGDGQKLSGIIMDLSKSMCNVRGQVRETTGRLVTGARVSLYWKGPVGTDTVNGEGYPPAVTDAEGRYHLENLPPGKWHIKSWHDQFKHTEPIAIELVPGKTIDQDLLLSGQLGKLGIPTMLKTDVQVEGESGFGLVTELLVEAGETKPNMLVDLDTGKTYGWPPEGMKSPEAMKPEEAMGHLKELGIDVAVTVNKDASCFVGSVESVLRRSIETDWERTTAGDVVSDKALLEDELGFGNITKFENDLPATYMFKTREGGMGLFQIVEFTDEPQGVKVRFMKARMTRQKVAVEAAKQRMARAPEQARAIGDLLREWFDGCVTGDVTLMKEAYPSPDHPMIEDHLHDMKELLGLNPGWQFSLLAVMWDESEAMAVSESLKHGDPKVGEPMILVWRLKKTEGHWLLSDIDLEELEGLQIENSRFMQNHPEAQVWFDNPDLNAQKADIGRVRETAARWAIAERSKPTGRIELLGLDLTAAPCTTKVEDLPELFEERPSGSGSYHIREGMTTVYNGLDGTVYYIPAKKVFYVQRDNAGASTLHYYGPFKGDPREVLGFGVADQVEAVVARQTDAKGESGRAEASVTTIAASTEQKQPAQPGRIRGVVLSAVTGEPIAGAYVGVGDFGDSGGSNYSRHREQGFFAKTKTDEQGRFELDGLVFTDESPELDYHPLVVTHPDFVRHDEKIELLKDKPAPDVKVRLGPAAKIDVTIVDAQGNSLEGQWLIRLEALDGRRFIPPGGDPHLSSFASSIWAHWPDLRAKKGVSQGFTFTELDTGEYSIEALRLQLVDNPTPGNIWVPTITYHGSIPKLKIDSGQTREVRVKPAAHQTAVAIKVPEVPAGAPKDREIHGLLMVSRKCELLVWDTGKVYHLEDHRLGRLQKNALFYVPVRPGQMYTIDNLPAGSYSVFASIVVYPALCMKGVKVEVVPGSEVMVEVPPIQISGQATVGLWTLNRSVKLEDRQYSVRELCTILTTITESNPRLLVDPSIENEKLQFSGQDMAIWDVLETICLEKKWRLGEVPERTLVLEPEASSTAGKHRVYVPDLETRNADVLLDLATGEMLGAVWLRENKIAQLGKGDLAYEYASNRGSLLCLRGATMQLRTKQGLAPLKPDVKREYLEGYFLEDVPCQFQVTTAEGNKFELQIFSIDEGDRGGAYIEFWASE